MKLFHLLCLLLILPLMPARAQQITIDESASKFEFLFIDDDVDGSIAGFEFDGAIDLSDLENSYFSGSVVMETLDTGNWLRNRHLRSRKYFSNKEHPELSFRSTSVKAAASAIIVKGLLSIKGTEKLISIEFRDTGTALVGSATIYTSDYGIAIHDDRQRNKLNIAFTLAYSKR